jgi:polysaccharide biosynthesis protein PslH
VKILIITPRIPYPPYRGDKLKIFNIAKRLAKNNEVTILTFHENQKSLTYIDELQKFGINTYTIYQPVILSLLKVALGIFSRLPFQVAYYSSGRMKRKIKSMVEENGYDVIYFHLIRSAQYLDAANQSKALKCLDFTDAVSLYLSRFSEVTINPLKKIMLKLELSRIQKYEPVAKKFDTLFICSEKDKDYLEKKKLHTNIQFLRNGFDEEQFKSEKIPYEKNRIIFTGNMPYFPNSDAAVYFSKEIFPLVREIYPTSKLYLVGQKPPAKLRNLASSNITVTGFVKDINKEYQQSEVNVVPIRFGAGTLNKVIEALALGIPTVATTMSVAGLPKELKKFILLADNPETFSEKITYVFENESVRNKLMKEAQKVVFNLLSWEKIVSEFEAYLNKRVQSQNKKRDKSSTK